jgi:hypothetical protein
LSWYLAFGCILCFPFSSHMFLLLLVVDCMFFPLFFQHMLWFLHMCGHVVLTSFPKMHESYSRFVHFWKAESLSLIW